MSYPQAKPGANPTTSGGPTPHLDGGEGSVQSRSNALQADLQRKHDQVESNALGWTAGGVPQFPAKYTTTDHDADTRFQMKKELSTPGSQPLGQTFVTDEDMKYLLNKRKLEERLVFDQFYSKLFDTKDINKLRLAQQIYPDYYKDRETEINREAELQKRIAMIKLRGPADLDDIKLIYVLLNGGVELRNAPLWRLDEAAGDLVEKYQRGLFSPIRFYKRDASSVGPAFMGQGMFGATGLAGAGNRTVNEGARSMLSHLGV